MSLCTRKKNDTTIIKLCQDNTNVHNKITTIKLCQDTSNASSNDTNIVVLGQETPVTSSTDTAIVQLVQETPDTSSNDTNVIDEPVKQLDDSVPSGVNKTIYMTYFKNVPRIVFDRWTALNTEYKIDFSLDCDCIKFLNDNFNDYVCNLFKTIPVGMYKADLWRLCKLYINGGIYADVDLVPYLNIDMLDKGISFYTCLTTNNNRYTIFQAFMVNFSKPNNPLILNFIISFLLNNPHRYALGPTFDMYNCIKYNLNNINIESDKRYDIEEVKIHVDLGTSTTNTKYIDLYYFPEKIEYKVVLIKNNFKDIFDFTINKNILIVKRIDENCGWNFKHSVNICIRSKESIFLFKENTDKTNKVSACYVSLNSQKILDSRDINYYKNKGW